MLCGVIGWLCKATMLATIWLWSPDSSDSCRSPYLWKDPDSFRPERFTETNSNPDYNGRWAGYRPEAQGSSLYPNEVASDFAFIPFGGGARKCVGDQFAMLEATVALSMLLR